MSAVTCVGTLGAAAVGVCDTTGPTLKDILVDVLLARPGEGTGVISAQHEEWGVVWMAVPWEDH